nr:copper resistance CopC family protein [Kineosporia rhizophila]
MAHDQIVESNPKDGANVKTLPDEIELVFNNNPLALGSVVRIESPDGDVTEGKPKIVDETLTQAIAAGAPAGKYTVQWRVTSSDGHPISGEFTFTAEAGNEPAAEPTETTGATGATGATDPTETAEPTGTAESTEGGAQVIESAEPSENTASAQSSSDEDGGASPVLIVTLLVLALLAIGAAVYVFVLAPKRSSDN